MSLGHYILEDRQPVRVDLMTWARWMEEHRIDRIVAKWDYKLGEVSTVFLGLDHQWDPDGPPLLFETMVFGGIEDGYCDRYTTWREAEQGHMEVCQRIRDQLRHVPVEGG